jgi:hypothetical protein
VGNFYTACFASATGFHLSLDYNGAANGCCCCFCFCWGVCDSTLQYGNTVFFEEVAGLILKKIQGVFPFPCGGQREQV